MFSEYDDDEKYYIQNGQLSDRMREHLDIKVQAEIRDAEDDRKKLEDRQQHHWYFGYRHYARTDDRLRLQLTHSYIADRLAEYIDKTFEAK